MTSPHWHFYRQLSFLHLHKLSHTQGFPRDSRQSETTQPFLGAGCVKEPQHSHNGTLRRDGEGVCAAHAGTGGLSRCATSITPLFTTAEGGSHPCAHQRVSEYHTQCTHNGMSFSHEQGQDAATGDHMDGP